MNEETRQKVLERDNNQCYFCDETENLHVHHVIPRKAGGKDETWNLKTVCASCHKKSEELHSRGLEKIKETIKEEEIEKKVQERLPHNKDNKILEKIKNNEDPISVDTTIYVVVFKPLFANKPEYSYVGANRERALQKLSEYDNASMKKWQVSVDLRDCLEDETENIEKELNRKNKSIIKRN